MATELRNAKSRRSDPKNGGPVLQSYVQKVPVTSPFFDAKRDDPVASFVEEAPKHPVFKLIAASDAP